MSQLSSDCSQTKLRKAYQNYALGAPNCRNFDHFKILISVCDPVIWPFSRCTVSDWPVSASSHPCLMGPHCCFKTEYGRMHNFMSPFTVWYIFKYVVTFQFLFPLQHTHLNRYPSPFSTVYCCSIVLCPIS